MCRSPRHTECAYYVRYFRAEVITGPARLALDSRRGICQKPRPIQRSQPRYSAYGREDRGPNRTGCISMDRSPAGANGHWSSRGSRLAFRHLWQVPLFGAGLLVFLVVGSLHPLWSHYNGQQRDRLLNAVRKAREQNRPDIDTAITKAELVLADPSHAARANRRGALSDRQRLSAPGRRWSQRNWPARSWELARAPTWKRRRSWACPPATRRGRRYRLGKTYALLRGDPQHVVDYLAPTVASAAADDHFEGYGLLAQAYLLAQPQCPCGPGSDAAPANARARWRGRAGPAALAVRRTVPPARSARRGAKGAGTHRSRRTAGNPLPGPAAAGRAPCKRKAAGAEAAQAWEQVKGDSRAASAGRADILYSLGLCYRKLDRNLLAAPVWEEARAVRRRRRPGRGAGPRRVACAAAMSRQRWRL